MQTGAAGTELEIQHEEHDGRGAFFVQGAEGRLAELIYSRAAGDRAVIEHTEVSRTLGGQGVGKRLVEAAVAWARRTGTRFVVECAFARTVFDRNPGLRDVLA
jgi:predicted GNAT family acetyltransferase